MVLLQLSALAPAGGRLLVPPSFFLDLCAGVGAAGAPLWGLLPSRSYAERRGGGIMRPHVLPQPAGELARGVLGRQHLEERADAAVHEDHHGVHERLGRATAGNGAQQHEAIVEVVGGRR